MLWTSATEYIRPLKQFQDEDLLYISGHATNKKGTWTVAAHKVLKESEAEAMVDGFEARVAFAAELLKGARSTETLATDTPMKCKAKLEQECTETTDIGVCTQ